MTADPEENLKANRIVLRGVGAFRYAMKVLNDLDLISVIHEVAAVISNKNIIGSQFHPDKKVMKGG